VHPDKLKQFDKRFIDTMTRNGKDIPFVNVDGLTDKLHEIGFSEIKSTLVCAPSTDNHQLAIFHCHLLSPDGKITQAHGDATPENVHPNVKSRWVAAAETRAIARAASLALNIDGVFDPHDQLPHDTAQASRPSPTPQPTTQPVRAPAPQPTQQTRGNGQSRPPDYEDSPPASDRQVRAVFAKCRALGKPKPLEDELQSMTSAEISPLLEQLANEEELAAGGGPDDNLDDQMPEMPF